MSCPVCFGGEDPVARESLNAGIGVLLGVTGVVLGCLGRLIVVLKRRAQFADQVDFTFPTSQRRETGFASSEGAAEPTRNETGVAFSEEPTRFLHRTY